MGELGEVETLAIVAELGELFTFTDSTIVQFPGSRFSRILT